MNQFDLNPRIFGASNLLRRRLHVLHWDGETQRVADDARILDLKIHKRTQEHQTVLGRCREVDQNTERNHFWTPTLNN